MCTLFEMIEDNVLPIGVSGEGSPYRMQCSNVMDVMMMGDKVMI